MKIKNMLITIGVICGLYLLWLIASIAIILVKMIILSLAIIGVVSLVKRITTKVTDIVRVE